MFFSSWRFCLSLGHGQNFRLRTRLATRSVRGGKVQKSINKGTRRVSAFNVFQQRWRTGLSNLGGKMLTDSFCLIRTHIIWFDLMFWQTCNFATF